MAKRTQFMGERLIESDSGLGWSFKRGSPALSIHPGQWVTEIFGHRYRLVKYAGAGGWCLYLGDDVNPHFYGVPCGATLPDAIDVASEKILKADLRGEGYERKERS